MADTSKNFTLHRHGNGSHTLIDAEIGQAMHSRIGPRIESALVYAEPARIEESLVGGRTVLYDVGMGIGANVIAVLDRIGKKTSARGILEIYSFETKPTGLETALTHLTEFPELVEWAAPLRQLLANGKTEFELGSVKVNWTLLVGDFYSRMEETPTPDVLFFDFYSPKVVPELWAIDRFTGLRAKIGDHPARLITYSVATPVRLRLLLAGFFVGKGASTAVKAETTVAATQKELLEFPLAADWLRKLETSPAIRGPDFAADRERLLKHPQWIKS